MENILILVVGLMIADGVTLGEGNPNFTKNIFNVNMQNLMLLVLSFLIIFGVQHSHGNLDDLLETIFGKESELEDEISLNNSNEGELIHYPTISIDEEDQEDEDDELSSRFPFGDIPDSEINSPDAFKCGIRNDDHKTIGQFPWIVGIFIEDHHNKFKRILVCGGSLIHPSVVLSAATCKPKIFLETLTVRAGNLNSVKKVDKLQYQDRLVVDFIKHDEFRKGRMRRNDIALLFLRRPFYFNPHIYTVCLPPPNISTDNQRCLTNSWRYVHNPNEKDSNDKVHIMQRIDLKVLPRDECLKILQDAGLPKSFVLHQSYICAKNEKGDDTCFGDGGSPLNSLVPYESNQYYQIGIVAWGLARHRKSQLPGAYTNVPQLRQWIDYQFDKRNLQKDYYIP